MNPLNQHGRENAMLSWWEIYFFFKKSFLFSLFFKNKILIRSYHSEIINSVWSEKVDAMEKNNRVRINRRWQFDQTGGGSLPAPWLSGCDRQLVISAIQMQWEEPSCPEHFRLLCCFYHSWCLQRQINTNAWFFFLLINNDRKKITGSENPRF